MPTMVAPKQEQPGIGGTTTTEVRLTCSTSLYMKI